MRGFKTRASVDELAAWIVEHISPLESEEIALGEAWGRVLARDPSPPARSPLSIGPRWTATPSGPRKPSAPRTTCRPLSVAWGGRDRACAARWPSVPRKPSKSRPVRPSPAAPMRSSRSNRRGSTAIECRFVRLLPQGRNVGRCGEDIAPGTLVLKAGRVVRPQDLGVLSAVGAAQVVVVRRPRVAALITGDELLAPGTPARDYQIPDVNSVMIAALVARDGGSCEVVGPLPDRRAAIRDAILDVASRTDLILVSGGSSAGPEDHVPGIVAELGRLIAHGLALRPASPTGLGLLRVDDRPVVMLPGNPVSCLCGYDFVAGPLLRRLGGRSRRWPYRSVTLPLVASWPRRWAVSITLESGSATARSSLSRSAERRSSPASPAPTGSSSSPLAWRVTPRAPASRSGVTMSAASAKSARCRSPMIDCRRPSISPFATRTRPRWGDTARPEEVRPSFPIRPASRSRASLDIR